MADGLDLNISVTFRHTESTPALKSYAQEKVSHCLKKFVTSGGAEVQVILSVEKRDHSAEVIVHSKAYNLSSTATTSDLYAAIDKVIDTLDAQLRKQKDRLVTAKHQAPANALPE